MSKTITIEVYDNDNDESYDVTLPAKYEVCERCEGEGKHLMGGYEGVAFTGCELADWSPEEQEDYMSGRYDVRCGDCEGRRVMLVIDENDPYMTPEQERAIALYHEGIADIDAMNREMAAERRMGA